MLSVALFAGAAAFALAAVRSVFTTLEQTSLRQQAVDLARSKMAELEAGLITLAELRGEVGGEGGGGGGWQVGSIEIDADEAEALAGPRWTFDLMTRPTEFTGLTLVELTVREARVDTGQQLDPGAGGGGAAPAPMSYTLRQLVALREESAAVYEQDELMRGLPAAAGAEGER